MYRISLSTARILYPTLLIGSVVLCNQVPFFVIALALTMAGGILSMTISLLRPYPCCPRGSPRRDDEDSHTLLGQQQQINGNAGAIAVQPPPSSSTRPRLHYLDNLKSVLTVIVVLHHTLGAFAGVGSLGLSVGNFRSIFQVTAGVFQILNQSYFMSLFFFLSALLTPSSFERKGVRAFLADKYKRLGIPFLLYFFILGPALTAVNDTLFIGRPTSYQPNAGPAWFLCWLLVFNTAYALVDPSIASNPTQQSAVHASYLVLPKPTLLTMCAWGVGAGVLQAVQIFFFPTYPFMPITFGSLPFDVLFFVGGLAAEKGGWLTHHTSSSSSGGEGGSSATSAISALHTKQVVWAKRGVVALSLVFIGGMVALYIMGGGAFLLSRNPCDHPPDRGLGDGIVNPTPLWLALLVLSMICVCGGVFIMCITVAALEVFRENFPEGGGWWKWAASVSYAVYLFHASLVLPLTGVFILTVRRVLGGGAGAMGMWSDAKGVALWDTPSCLVKGGGVLQEVVLFGGFFAVSAATLALVYPLAMALKKVPGFKEVL